MKAARWLNPGLLVALLAVMGCTYPASERRVTPPEQPAGGREALQQADEAQIANNLAQLSPEDRKLAEAQKYCAVENGNRLGGMAVPYKVMVNGQPVFLCCSGCKREALADPDKTLAKVEELKARAAAEAKEAAGPPTQLSPAAGGGDGTER